MAEGPFIELMECPIAGFQFHGGEACWGRIALGDGLVLRRQPGNRHDARAIVVEWQGVMLGYVPREANYALSQMMDRGATIAARVKTLRNGPDPWQRVMMEVAVTHAQVRPAPTPAPVEECILVPGLSFKLRAIHVVPSRTFTAAQHQLAADIFDDCLEEIARRLAFPTAGRRQALRREVRLFDTVVITSDHDGRRLDIRALHQPAFFPHLSLDLKRPLSAERWVSCFSALIEATCARHGMSQRNTPPGLHRWIREMLRAAFEGLVDWETLRKPALDFLAPEPLARSLANRIFGPSPMAASFNLVCPRTAAIAMCAVEQPAMLPFLRVVLDETGIPANADMLEALRNALVEYGMPPAAWKKLAAWGWPTFEEHCDDVVDVAAAARLLHELGVQSPPPPAFLRLAIAAASHRGDPCIDLDFARDPPWFHRALLREAERIGEGETAPIRDAIPIVVDWLLDAKPEADANQQKAGWPWIVAQAEAHQAARALALSKPWRVPLKRLSWPGYEVIAIESGRELLEEAQAMKNCLDTYEDACREGTVIVFSIRAADTGKRVACFAANREHTSWDLMEVAGKMNQSVTPEIRLIANAAVAKLNDWRAKHPG